MGLPYKTKLLVFSAVMGGFLFGYDTGVMSGCLVALAGDEPTWDLEERDSRKELIVSAAIWACAVGALMAGFLNKFLGRKISMMAGAAILTVASFIMAIAPSWQILVVGRALDGIAIGFVSMTGPLYIAEQLPNDWRGPMTVCNQLLITIGILVGSIVAGIFEPISGGWRWMLGLSCVPSTIMFVLFIFMPKSARWLYFRGDIEQAKAILIELRGTEDVSKEMNEIAEDFKQTNENEKLGGKGFEVLVNMMKNKAVRRALFLGVMLQLFQQFSGINSVMYYSATILVMSGASANKAIWLSTAVSTANVTFTFIGLFGVERFGRKKLLLGSMAVMMLGLSLLGVAFIVITNSSKAMDVAGVSDCAGEIIAESCYSCVESNNKCGICEGASGSLMCLSTNVTLISDITQYCASGVTDIEKVCKTKESWLAIVGLIIYIMGFAPGMGPLPWTINSEIFPNWARDTALSLTTFTNWVCNSIISQTFLQLSNAATPSGAFFTYCAITFVGMVYFFICLPETKGISLEHTEELFESRLTFAGFKAGYEPKNKNNYLNE
ncbi:uncharacterized protein LOC134815725 [Bolinopsis microptera]|uniref:uncharacterized protein LOC134815725 n=1 Tax=Bolinopsis microptera TaxID=2820187 RepID=UPI003079D1D5